MIFSNKKIFEAIVCIAFPFFIDTKYWDAWKRMNGVYFFYLSIAAIACGVSIIIYVIHLLRAYRSLLSNWTKIVNLILLNVNVYFVLKIYINFIYGNQMMAIDVIFAIFALIDGIAFAVIANDHFRYSIYNGPVFAVCSVFSFLSLVLFVIDIYLWSRSSIQL